MSRYDQERFDPAPDPDLVCCICQAVLDGPMETPCRHVFCKVCIETWLSNHETCPTCRKNTQNADLRPVLPLIQNMINRLQMKCANFNNGCINTVSLEIISSHESNCGYENVDCRFTKCTKHILKKDKEEHEKVCEHREVMCAKDCGLLVVVRELQTHDCLVALRTKMSEQKEQLAMMDQKVTDLTSIRDNLYQKLGNAERKLEEALQRLRRVNDDSFSEHLSDFNDNASTRTWNTEYTLDGLDSIASNNTGISVVDDSPVNRLVASQDSADPSNITDSDGGNSPMILFSSNPGMGVQVNVHGNASVSYDVNDSRDSGSETSGFIAESSGYAQSPVQDFLFDSENDIDSRQRQDDSQEYRPISPEPPYARNNLGNESVDTDSNAEGSAPSPVRSHYSQHTLSDTDAADAVNSLVNLTPPYRPLSVFSPSPSVSSRLNFSPSRSVNVQSADDEYDLQGFTSSDDVSDEVESDKEKNQGGENDDTPSDGEEEYDNSVYSVDAASNLRQNDSDTSRSHKSRGFLSSDSGSSVVSNTSYGDKFDHGPIDSDHESNGSNLTFSMSSRSSHCDENKSQDGQVAQQDSVLVSEETDQADLQCIMDQFVSGNPVRFDQEKTGNDDHVEKSMAQLTKALEEMEDEADAIDAELRNIQKDVVGTHEGDGTDDDSYVDVIGIVQGNSDQVGDPLTNSLSLRDHVSSHSDYRVVNSSTILNTSDSSITEVNSRNPLAVVTHNSAVKLEVLKDKKPSTDSRQNSRSRFTRQTTRDIQVPSSRREQDRYLELLEDLYPLKREDKHRDIERYVNHVQRMMSLKGESENTETASNTAGPDCETSRCSTKRKYDQQAEVEDRGDRGKKPKYEVSDGTPKLSSGLFSSGETPIDPGRGLLRKTSGAVPSTSSSSSNRKFVDRKQSWDPKNLNISLNVAINLDKTGRVCNQATSTRASLPIGNNQHTLDRSTGHSSRRSVPPNFWQVQRSTQEKNKLEGTNQSIHQIDSSSFLKTESSSLSFPNKTESRSSRKASSTVSKPPPAEAALPRPTRVSHSAPLSAFTASKLASTDGSSSTDEDWQPTGDEPTDVSITSSESDEEDVKYKLKIPIPTATLLEKYCEDSDSDDSYCPAI